MNSTCKGITYDTGFEPYGPANSSRKVFETDTVRREMEIIAGDLHCSHVRITGEDPYRIAAAAHNAVKAGLVVWFSPFPCNLTPGDLVSYLNTALKKPKRSANYQELRYWCWAVNYLYLILVSAGQSFAGTYRGLRGIREVEGCHECRAGSTVLRSCTRSEETV